MPRCGGNRDLDGVPDTFKVTLIYSSLWGFAGAWFKAVGEFNREVDPCSGDVSTMLIVIDLCNTLIHLFDVYASCYSPFYIFT